MYNGIRILMFVILVLSSNILRIIWISCFWRTGTSLLHLKSRLNINEGDL